MKRVRIAKAGGYERLEIETTDDPKPGKGEVRIAVEAIGVNFADCIVRMGLYASAKEYVGWPITPGFEVAGVIDEIGDSDESDDAEPTAANTRGSDLKVGDRVIALTRFGAYATSLCVPRRQAFRIPEGWSMAQAAAFPVVYLTADYALFELVHPRKGATILVHSAAGGVGGAILQLAKTAGVNTVGVVGRAQKVEAAKKLGATHVIDKSTQDLWAEAKRIAPKGYDAVLDANGVSTLAESYKHLRGTGRLIIYGFHSMMRKDGPGTPNWAKLAVDWVRTPRFNPLDLTNDNKSVMAFNLSYLFEEQHLLDEAMDRLMKLVAEGAIEPPPTQTFAFESVADAHRAIETGNTTGKLVLTV